MKRREDDRETRVVHPDYKRNGFHVWSFNEAKTIAGEEEKKNVNGLHRIFKRPLLFFVLPSFLHLLGATFPRLESRPQFLRVVSHTFLLSSPLLTIHPLHLPLRFYPISFSLRKTSPRNVNFCLADYVEKEIAMILLTTRCTTLARVSYERDPLVTLFPPRGRSIVLPRFEKHKKREKRK